MLFFLTVPQSHCVLIERFGRYHRTLRQGFHLMVPMVDQVRQVPWWADVANKQGYQIELTEQHTDTPPRDCHTRDNVVVRANASVYWRITDPVKAVYEVDILPQSVADIALNALRAEIGRLDLDSVLSEREQLSDRIAGRLKSVVDKWGVSLTRIEIQELTTNDETARAMRQQMEAERHRRAMVSEAAGRAEAELALASAQAQASSVRATGQASALRKLAEAEAEYLSALGGQVGAERAAELLLAQKYLDAMAVITTNPANKVFLPTGMQNLVSHESAVNGSPPVGRS